MAQKKKKRKSDNPIVAGPTKQDLGPKRKGPRLTRHKKRSAWFQARAAWPLREASVHRLIQERNRAKANLPPAAAAQWELIGPTNIGGRITSIVCHPQSPDMIWAGAAGGGVWQSVDAGKTWHSVWRDQDILNIGSLAIDPKNPSTLYCGTGEANLSADSYAGVGIFRSTDAGTTWTLIAPSATTGIPTRIGVIAIDPFDSAHLRIGGVGANEMSPVPQDFGGMFVSRDGGSTWQRETFISAKNYWCHAIVFDSKNQGVIYATFTEQGSKSGIWKSADGGKSWTQLRTGLPRPERFGRTSLAISPSQTNTLYAFAEDVDSQRSDMLLGVFRTNNAGKSWADVGGTRFTGEQQISYGNTIAIHPLDPDRVICGGVDLHSTNDGGKNWKKVTHWDSDRGKSNYAHADHHHLLIPEAAPERIYDPNDGGLDVSDDGGRTWSNRSNGLAVTMFYDMDAAQSDGRNFGGGAQDNGTVVTDSGHSGDFFEILGGDGGWMIYDPNDAGHIYASYYNMGIWRFRAGRWKDVSPPAKPAEQNSVWMVFIVMDPRDSKTVFTGSTRVWRTRNDAQSWQPVSPPLDGSPISAIEISEADSKKIFVGTENGGFFRSLDGGDTWSPNLSGATLPGHIITRIDTARGLGANGVLVTVGNFGHSHVFQSRDGGTTWQDVDQGQLPDVPHHAVVIRPDDPNTFYVGNDAGVYVSSDTGQTWRVMTGNLPNSMVVDMVLHRRDKTLSVATYGRSIWRTSI
jgi:photosystem II stability/assembly factor-like uncharacterized protein